MVRELSPWNAEVKQAHAEAREAVDKLLRAVVRQKIAWGTYDHLQDHTGTPVDMTEEMDGAMISNFVVAADYQVLAGEVDDNLFVCSGAMTTHATKVGLASMMLDEFNA